MIARIGLVADDAPATETEKQMALLRELLSNQPAAFAGYLGYEVYFRQKRYRPAVECFKRSLAAIPADAGTRLNMGLAYNKLGMFSEADDAASYVFNDRTTLTDHGYAIAFQVRANAALGRREFAKALEHAEKAFQYEAAIPSISVWQLAAALNGDLDRFYQVIETSQKAFPRDYANAAGSTEVLEAYVLFKNNQVEKARQIAKRWTARDGLDANATYWSQYPSGDDVVKCWKDLRAEN